MTEKSPTQKQAPRSGVTRKLLDSRPRIGVGWTRDLPGHDWSWRGTGGWYCLKCGWVTTNILDPKAKPSKGPCVGRGEKP